jgi:dTDP-glucose pyrophosphorylase
MQEAGRKITGVILAAGMGKRIYPLSNKVPKAILPVCNRPLIEYQIEMMKNCGLSEILVVIGSNMGSAIVKTLGDGTRFGMKLRYVEQKELLGTAHALGLLEELINSPLLVFLGDIYLIIDDLCQLIEEVLSGKVNAVLVSKIEENPKMIMRNFSICETQPGLVCRVIEKPRYTDNQIKGCGVYIFDQNIFDAVRRTPRTAMRNEYEITDSIQIMIDDGLLVAHRPVVKNDLNLTFAHELLELNLMELKRRRLNKIVGENASIPSEALIENSVIGEGAIVRYPIRIKNSLIFPGVRVDSKTDINNAIIHKKNVIQCHPKGLD